MAADTQVGAAERPERYENLPEGAVKGLCKLFCLTLHRYRELSFAVHEGTLVHAISILALWCGRFVTEVPKTLVEWFKKAFSLKACTSAVRHAYLQCMLASFKGNVLLQGSEMLPLLIQTVEKAGAQSTQIPLVTEGVAAALLICRLSVADAQIVMCTVLQLTERLLLDHECRLPGAKIQQYYKALTAVLLSRSWSVRRLAQQTVRKLLSLPRGFKLACGLLEELKAVLVSHKVLPPEALVTESGELSEQGKTYIPPRILQEALCVIACGPGMEGELEEKEKLVLEMLLVSSHPSLVLSECSWLALGPSACQSPPSADQHHFCLPGKPGPVSRDPRRIRDHEDAGRGTLRQVYLAQEIKKKKGIKEEIQLTSKQKEMLTAQLEKESQMRKQLKERNPPSLSQYIPALVGCFLPLLKSPLAAPRIKAPFLSLVSCVMPDHLKTFGTVASHVTLRMMKPECDLDESWCQEDLPTAVNRVIGLLHTHTVPTRITKGEEGPAPLSAPAFSLVFPLLKMVLLETPNDSEEKEELLVKVLQIITVLGSVALTALCASSSGEDGCAYAEQEEINVLLQALQSPCMNVRDAALRGLMELQMVLPTPDSDEKNGMNLLRRLWVVKFDREEEIRMLAERLWVSMALELQPDICSILIQDVIHHEQARPPPVLDALGRVILESPPDQWEARCCAFPILSFPPSGRPCATLWKRCEAAAKTFEQLHSTIGFQALEDILPFLLKQLLISPPVNTRVLAFLSSVAGDALTRHLEDEAGQRIIIEDLLDTTRSAEVGRRQAAAVILNIYCSKTKADYTAHLRNLVSGLIRLFNDTNAVVLNESWDALNAISKLALIDDLHRKSICCLMRLRAWILHSQKGAFLKGVTSILPMLREGVLTGNSDQKEEAAKALGLVIKLTSAEALKPSVVSITGPLIRILGDRFSWNVKVALLETLSLLLAKVGLALKPFLPQLQTTFTKALQDPNRVVRLKAAEALGKLIAIHAKVDPLFTELLNGIRTSEDSGIRQVIQLTREKLMLPPPFFLDTMLQALRFVTQGAGGKVDAAVRKSIISMLLSMLGHEEIPIAVSGIRGMGFLMKHHIEANGGNLPPKLSNLFIKCLQNPSSDIKLIAEKMIWWANKAPLLPLDPPVAKPILKALLDNTKDKNTSVRAYSDQAIVNLLKMRDGEETVQILDAASLELLNESCRRSLKKLANQADSVEQIDDTLLT
ncbi:putative Translational activator GCN1-like protein [Naja naja]|nr:putative Translational activator GCN1-like protein [Naja naja]